MLGRIVEVISGQSLYDYEKAHVLDPLGMTDTGFGVPTRPGRTVSPSHSATTATSGWTSISATRVIPCACSPAAAAWCLPREDYARFMQAMLAGGTLDGQRVIGPATERYMTADQLGSVKPGPYYLPGPGYGFGLGVAVRTQPRRCSISRRYRRLVLGRCRRHLHVGRSGARHSRGVHDAVAETALALPQPAAGLGERRSDGLNGS